MVDLENRTLRMLTDEGTGKISAENTRGQYLRLIVPSESSSPRKIP